jgi:putative ABC transport system permease protein
MLESVCASAPAGLLAVGSSIVLVRKLPLERILSNGTLIAHLPGFPVAAAVEGLTAATAVGAPCRAASRRSSRSARG